MSQQPGAIAQRAEADLELQNRPTAPSGGSISAATQESSPAISVERLSKRLGGRGRYALNNISLSIPRGQVFSLLGPQGAGKSTLVKLLIGFLHPDEGSIRLLGTSDLRRARARIGYLPEHPGYHGNFSGIEYLTFHAQLSGLRGRAARREAERLLALVGLPGREGRKWIRSYRQGVLQRFGLAVALASAGSEPPELLLLDEPSSNLEDEEAELFRDIVLEYRRLGTTVLLASHRLTEVERTSDSVGILRGGKLFTQASLQESPRTHVVALPRSGAAEILPSLTAYLRKLHPQVTVEGGQREGEPLRVSLPAGPRIAHAEAIKAAALRALVDGRWDIQSLHVELNDLETLYRRAVQPQIRPTPAPVGAAAPADAAGVRGPAQDGAAAGAQAGGSGRATSPLPPLDIEAGSGEPAREEATAGVTRDGER